MHQPEGLGTANGNSSGEGSDGEAGVQGAAVQKGEVAEASALTGKPREADVLMHCLPVCAPYSVMQGYKYKLKLVPGSLKRGKASKQALEIFSKLPICTGPEKELMRILTDAERVSSILGSVSIMAASAKKNGGSKKKGGKRKVSNKRADRRK